MFYSDILSFSPPNKPCTRRVMKPLGGSHFYIDLLLTDRFSMQLFYKLVKNNVLLFVFRTA